MPEFIEAFDTSTWDDENLDMAVCGIIRNSDDYVINNLLAILRYVVADLPPAEHRWWADGAQELFKEWLHEAARCGCRGVNPDRGRWRALLPESLSWLRRPI